MSILDDIIATLGEEERVMLATIVAATGSTPAAASSKLLLRRGGASPVGTIGGGCMEGEVVVRARQLYDGGFDEIMTCDLDDEETANGLICGGRVEILLEHLTRTDLELFQDLRALDERGEDCVVATLLGDDRRVAGRGLTHPAGIAAPVRWRRPDELSFLAGRVPTGLAESVASVLRKGEPARVPVAGGTLLLEPWFATPRLVIFGGGHVGRCLSRAAAAAGFRVTVADDREKYANAERFPEASATRVIDFAAAAAMVGPGAYAAIVTRGHAFDETVLEQVLATDARYIGMIGSKKKVLAAMRHLHARGVPLDRLKSVHAPIGLEIGAVTAEEIAVSIVAQLIRVRRGCAGPAAYDKSDDARLLLQDLGPQQLIATQ
jgi:xanthine dehydrogenase accessory factor